MMWTLALHLTRFLLYNVPTTTGTAVALLDSFFGTKIFGNQSFFSHNSLVGQQIRPGCPAALPAQQLNKLVDVVLGSICISSLLLLPTTLTHTRVHDASLL